MMLVSWRSFRMPKKWFVVAAAFAMVSGTGAREGHTGESQLKHDAGETRDVQAAAVERFLKGYDIAGTGFSPATLKITCAHR
jgi:hypothetical protein